MPESSTPMPRNGWIELATHRRGPDRHGRDHPVSRIEIHRQGFIPDVYVRFDRDVLDLELYDDSVFVGWVNAVLRELGYQGKPFGRAELGLQGRSFIVLEPGREFRAFVIERYHWQDLTEFARAYRPD